jgi:hypothetical protein
MGSSKWLFCHHFLTFTESFKGLQMGEIFLRVRSLIAAFDHGLATLSATVATQTGACFNIDPKL